MTSSDPVLAAQLDYYRARAAEYDETSYGVLTDERRAVPAIVDRLGLSGDIAELACGTGVWTVELARHAASLTAIDGAPEMLAFAKERAPTTVQFVISDIFEWRPDREYDVIFFAAWLSHVPANRFAEFWSIVESALLPGGRAIALDELPARIHHEERIDGEIADRTLSDGRKHQIVKVFYEPAALIEQLAALGWQATVTPIAFDWFVLEAVCCRRKFHR